MIFFTIARPSPVPFALVVTYGSNARCRTSSAKPVPGVGDGERHGVGARLERDLVAGLGDLDLRVDGVLQKVVEHLAQPGRLALNDDRARRERQREARAQIVVQREHVLQQGGEVDRLHRAGPRLPRIDRKVVDHVFHCGNLRDDRLRTAL